MHYYHIRSAAQLVLSVVFLWLFLVSVSQLESQHLLATDTLLSLVGKLVLGLIVAEIALHSVLAVVFRQQADYGGDERDQLVDAKTANGLAIIMPVVLVALALSIVHFARLPPFFKFSNLSVEYHVFIYLCACILLTDITTRVVQLTHYYRYS